MCNNTRINRIVKEEEVVKDKISDWLEDRNGIERNKASIEVEEISDNMISYITGHPLKLNDGTRVHEIKEAKIDDKYKEIAVRFSKAGVNSYTARIKRYNDDDLKELEKFLANCQSIFQLINIDLNYM